MDHLLCVRHMLGLEIKNILMELSLVSKTDAPYAILIKSYIQILHINIKARE